MTEEIVLKIVHECYPRDMKAAAGRGEDAVGLAVDNEPLPSPESMRGRANDVFSIIEHIYKAATFVKCVVDVALALRKEGREVNKDDVKAAAQTRKIYIPSDAEIDRILEANRRLMR